MKAKYLLLISLIPIFLFKTSYNQEASVSFNVNMAYQIELGNFDPEVDIVDLAGDFNEWGTELTPLSDDDNDTIYTVVVDGFTIGQIIQFKFRYNGVWDGTEEFPGAGNNRVHTIATIYDSLYFWYNDQVSPNGPPTANFYALETNIKTGSVVPFQNISSGNIENWYWTFEGGFPEISTKENPRVSYNVAGTFDVQLVAGNSSETDTLLFEDYITVEERDKTEISWWNNTVFYEIFVRSFYDSDGDGIGDFNGIIEKLDYLNDGDPTTYNDLGVTGIWLMPINPSPSYHGYDVTDYMGVNDDYGTMDDFQNFLEAAHSRGIKVIIDYVMNHSSSQHPWFIDSKNDMNGKRNYYRWEDEDPGQIGPWGQDVWHYHSSGYYYGLFWGGMPDLNYNEPQVKDSMFMIADYWLNDIGVDGFRLDAVKYIYEEGDALEDLPATFQFWKDFNTHTKQTAPNSFSVGEAWTSTSNVVKYVEDDGLDFCFEFDLAYRAIDAVNSGYAVDLSNKTSIVYSVYPHLQWGTFLTNHDMNRSMNVFGEDDEKAKLAASIYLALPGIPFIYYGEEIGMLGEKPDEDIRRPMQWSNSYQGGFSTVIPWHEINSNYPTYNVETELADSSSILNRYIKAITIRNLKSALREGDYLEAFSEHDAVLSFIRASIDDTAIVVINTSSEILQDVSVEMIAANIENGTYTWWEMMKNQPATISINDDNNLIIPTMEAYEINIWSFDEISSVNKNFIGLSDEILIYPNPAQDFVIISLQKHTKEFFRISLYNSTGQLLFVEECDGTIQSKRINIAALEPGLYHVVADIRNSRITKKLVKF